MCTKLLCFLLALAILSSAHGYQKQQQEQNQDHQPEPEPYSFSYSAESNGGLSTHQESGDGTGRVTGFYTIQGEDGRERRVDYVADENGYRASIKTNEVGTRSQSSADALYEAQLPSAKQLEAAKISYEQYKYLEDTHQTERERTLARVSQSGHKKHQAQSQSANLNQQQKLTTSTGQQQFSIDSAVNSQQEQQQGQQFFGNQQVAQKKREQASGWQASGQDQQQYNRSPNSSDGIQYNQQTTVGVTSTSQAEPSTPATTALDDSLDWRQFRGSSNLTNTATANDRLLQRSGPSNQQIAKTDNRLQVNSETTQGQMPQWLQIQMSRLERPVSTTVLQKQLEQQFMLQATQLTDQDYPRQTPVNTLNQVLQKSNEQRLSQERPMIPVWNANQKLVGGPYQQQVEQSRPFNQQQTNIINELVEQPENNQALIESQSEYGQQQQQQLQQQQQQQVVNQPVKQAQQVVVVQPMQQQPLTFPSPTTQRVPQELEIINLNEQAQGQLQERPTERPQVVMEIKTEQVELPAGKPVVSIADQQAQQEDQQSKDGGAEEVSVTGGQQDEIEEQLPVQQVNNQQQNTPSTTTVGSVTTSTTTTTTTTTPTTISSNNVQEAEQPKRPQQVMVADDTKRPIRPNSIKQIIENVTRQPVVVVMTTQQQATKGSAQVIVDNPQQQFVDVQQPPRFTGMIMRSSSPRPVEATTLTSFIRQEIPITPAGTVRPVYVTSSVELENPNRRPLPQVTATKTSSLAGLRRVNLPKMTFNTTLTASVAPQEPTTRAPQVTQKTVEQVYTTIGPQVQPKVYQPTSLNQTVELVNQPKVSEAPQPQPQWKGAKGGVSSRTKQRQFWNNSREQPQLANVNRSSAITSSGANYQGGILSNSMQRLLSKALPSSRPSQQPANVGDGGFGYRVANQPQQ